MSVPTTPQWAQWIVAALLVASGLFALIAGWGLARLRHFFLRMHPPALVATGASWCVTLAVIVYFSTTHNRLAPGSWLIIIVLSITVPITSILLARATLFRKRQQNDTAMPAPLSPWRTNTDRP
ncbi:MAG: monovalent cation/H(+) antiporter subunit G [Brachymonas sp.]